MRQQRPYVNHNDIRRILSNTLLKDGPRLVTIRAASGKGKSTLLSWFEDQCSLQEIACVSLTFREVRSFDGFQVLGALTRKLKVCAFDEYKQNLSELLASTGASVTIQNINLEGSQISGIQAIGSDPVRKRYILGRLSESWFSDLDQFAITKLDPHRVIVVLDTFEEASDDAKAWLDEAVQLLRERINIVLVIAGQEKIHVDLARWKDECRQLELPAELEYRWWREYAAGTGALDKLGEAVLRQYHQKFRGDPYMMSQLCDLETS